jgi:hypothetical protein
MALFKVNTDGSNLVKIVEDKTAGPAITADGQHVLSARAGSALRRRRSDHELRVVPNGKLLTFLGGAGQPTSS